MSPNTPKTETEDNVFDVIQKAFNGMSSDKMELPDELETNIQTFIKKNRSNSANIDLENLVEIATHLNLSPDALCKLATNSQIHPPALPETIRRVVLPFGPYSVNSYLVETQNDNFVLIDAGYEPQDLTEILKSQPGEIEAVIITHNHRDHVGAISEIIRSNPNLPIYAFDASIIRHTQKLNDGDQIVIGPLSFKVIHTPGHAPDGICLHISQNGIPLAVATGDTVYARSAGKILNQYQQALTILKKKILSFPNETLLLPGHGPVTNVGTEIALNPFFA